MTEEAVAPNRRQQSTGARMIRLRYPARCACGRPLVAGDRVGWEPRGRVITCRPCLGHSPGTAVELGRAGDSLLRAGTRRSRRRVRLLQGAAGERLAATEILGAAGWQATFLLNRRPAARAYLGDVDMIAIGPSGVHVLDIKCYAGSHVETNDDVLTVNGRDATKLLASVRHQVDSVRACLQWFRHPGAVPVWGTICFVGTDLSWLGAPMLHGVSLVDTQRAVNMIVDSGPCSPAVRLQIGDHLDRLLPPA